MTAAATWRAHAGPPVKVGRSRWRDGLWLVSIWWDCKGVLGRNRYFETWQAAMDHALRITR